MHGYIVLELTKKVFDEEKYYCRLDWGADGLYIQFDEDVEKLVLYDKKIEDWAAAANINHMTRTVKIFRIFTFWVYLNDR